ncbi:corticotropin-releasing factor receptor 1-like isoform X2 [Biomphalaria glabrata]|uniref:Corticotropin-releasing factor receptor 1-like isoform X2 n=1 Tax=Biomphalaria glabrata TaxID=6526 RepID=A0A9W2YCP4_BIOGL|nr:corticotropin-releasing factor receptor 1-like isoform X2 [Biomphalaria glabrata]
MKTFQITVFLLLQAHTELYEAAVTTPNVIIQKILRSMTEKQKEKWEQSMLTCINTTYTLDPDSIYCNFTTDISCWPPTRAGSTAEVQCFEHQVTNTKYKASRVCSENGTWSKAIYLDCFKQDPSETDFWRERAIVKTIFDIGYPITCVVLIVAITMFLYFKTLRCLRNLIHCNLMIAMLISNIKYILSSFTKMKLASVSYHGCRVFVFFMTYFNTAIYFWMFVEGVYLLSIVIWAYQAHKIRLWHFLIVGWGCPLIVTIIWAGFMATYDTDDVCWLPVRKSNWNEFSIHTIIVATCSTLLVINVLIVAIVVWILVRKLRSSTTIETHQVRKATRAIVVLLPLLGLHLILTYALELISPTVQIYFFFLRNFLQSIQGILVSILFCFMNNEVQTTLRLKINALKTSRSIHRYTANILSTRSRTSIQPGSSAAYNVIEKSPQTSVLSKCSVDEQETCISLMDSAV